LPLVNPLQKRKMQSTNTTIRKPLLCPKKVTHLTIQILPHYLQNNILIENILIQPKNEHSNNKQNFNGYFQITVEGNKAIANSAVTITYKNTILVGVKTGNQLVFNLPLQVFAAGKSGTINLDVVYHTMGNYKWNIAVAQ
jgi:hypothetical protein